MVKPKGPPNLPAVGDYCRLRGKSAFGILRRVNERNWAFVDWVPTNPGPVIVGLFELEKMVSGPSCKTCAYCEPASDPKAAKSYVRCVAPIAPPPLPTCGDQREVFAAAVRKATTEPSNWTTIAHVEGRVLGAQPAGSDCPVWRARE